MSDKRRNAFEEAAAKESGGNLVSEMWGFLAVNRKWWLLPIIFIFLVFGLIGLVAGTGAAPFIYAIF
jgi:hypothetical protein